MNTLTGPTTGRTIVLIACTKQKRREASPARELYASTWFRKALAYADSLVPWQPAEKYTFILSARHGLLQLDQVVEPYDTRVADLSAEEREAWAEQVALRFRELGIDPWSDKFIILAGREYREALMKHLSAWEAPLRGMGIGQQIAWFTRQIAERLHFSRT